MQGAFEENDAPLRGILQQIGCGNMQGQGMVGPDAQERFGRFEASGGVVEWQLQPRPLGMQQKARLQGNPHG